MLALITRLDGSNAGLFHVEQSDNRRWLYQFRWPGSRAEEFREWSPERRVAGDHAVEPLLDPTVIAECRWRWEDEEVESLGLRVESEEADSYSDSQLSTINSQPAWQEALPHEWGDASADFHVIVQQPRDFREDPLVHAVALVHGKPAAFELVMPRRQVEAGEIFTVTGTALVCGPSSVLRAEGDFVCRNEAFSIVNAGAGQVTLLPVAAKLPESLPFTGAYAVKLGVLPPAEIELLRAYVAEMEASGA